jgi:hypothetical protein
MKFINKLERKLGRYAIPNLMKYISILYVLGLVIGSFNPEIIGYLNLDFQMVLKGQIWRLVTFIIPISTMNDIFFVFIRAYVFYFIGSTLERAWGPFRLNFYFFSGVFYNIIAALVVFLITGKTLFNALGMYINAPLDLIYSSLFFAFAALFPNMQFWIYFILPVKAKYLAWVSGAYYIYLIYNCYRADYLLGAIPIVVSLLNFVIFFFTTRSYQRYTPKEFERRAKYRRQMNEGRNTGNVVQMNGRNVVTRHKCAVCGRTELDNDQLEFRFCSKCDGNYEYCMDHLFTHEHVKR